MIENDNLYFLQGGQEMGRLLRENNWEATPLGPATHWPQSLRTTLDNMLHSPFPMFLFWGDEHICFYNDAYRPSLGINGKHPSILGQRAQEAWPEIWDDISPMINQVMTNGDPVWSENRLLPIFRNGQMEDVYWTFGYSPVRNGSGKPNGVLVVCTETTEAVKTTEKLVESEQRFRTMAEATSLMISLDDEKGKAIYFNEAWSKFTGKKMDHFLEEGWSELIHPEDRPSIIATFKENLEQRKKWEAECRLLNGNGKYRWISTYVSPRFSPDGSFAGFVSSAFDNHERKVLEQEATKFRFMANTSSDPFILMCKDGSFEYLNTAALEKWGYDEKEAEALKVTDVDSIFDQKKFEKLFARAQKTDIPAFETLHRSKDGKEFPVEVNVSGFRLNDEPLMFGIARDISERKKAENDLKESESRFRELADQSPMWIWITDAEVKVEYANRDLLDYIGIHEITDFTGQVWEDIVHPEDIGRVYEGFGQAVEKRTGFSLDYRVRKASTGIYEWFTVKGVPRFEGKKLTGFIGTGMNVHREKTFSEQLRKEVGLRTKELADANTELEKSNKELQSFAYISSHDLQEPLRKIQTFCSLLLDNEYERLSEKGKNQFARMESAAKRMQVLINDLLAYSRLEMEDRKFETMDLSQILEKVKADLSDEIEQKGATVELANSMKVNVVHFQFRQLLYNLISNSLKYSSDDRPPVIRIDSSVVNSSQLPDNETLLAKEYIRIRVTDNGIGFDNAYAEKIFEVFQRLHGRKKYRGTGVGLAIVKKIAENHNGFIKAMGVPGKGASFDILLPKNYTSA
ncbi:PAS domain S-box protein [Pricia sp.]|uniref:PAS domain-containing sensor histidine kinase n=1 Tax=Pricia sp. TaxID=2268138 RepID=UPI003593EAAC